MGIEFVPDAETQTESSNFFGLKLLVIIKDDSMWVVKVI